MNIDLYAGDLDQALRAIIPHADPDQASDLNVIQVRPDPGGKHVIFAAASGATSAAVRVRLVEPDGELFDSISVRVSDAKHLRLVFAPGKDEGMDTRRLSAAAGGKVTCVDSSGLFGGDSLSFDQVKSSLASIPTQIAERFKATVQVHYDGPVSLPAGGVKRFHAAAEAFAARLNIFPLENGHALVVTGNCVGFINGEEPSPEFLGKIADNIGGWSPA